MANNHGVTEARRNGYESIPLRVSVSPWLNSIGGKQWPKKNLIVRNHI